MTQKITANEIFVQENGARIRTRCAKRYVTDSMVAWAVQYARLNADDTITVACMDHTYSTVHWRRTYLVAERRDFLQRTENADGDVKHAEAFSTRVHPLTDWEEITPEPVSLVAVDKGPVHKWWVEDSNGKAIAKGLDEKTAHAIASGAMPVPEAA